MSARHGGGPHVVLEPQDNLAEGARRFVIYDDLGQVSDDIASFDPFSKTIKIKQSISSEWDSQFLRLRNLAERQVEPTERYFGLPGVLPDRDLIADLGRAMRFDYHDVDSETPAGYTYLGQFIFHDISRLKTGSGSAALPDNLRSAALDLDSIFDLVDFGQISPCSLPSTAMPIGCTEPPELPLDLPRTASGCPLIADPRNDDLLPLAQIHMALIRFYNAIVERVGDGPAAKALCQTHFQSIVLHDYLPRVIDEDAYRHVLDHGRAVIHARDEAGQLPSSPFILPVEFAAACGRFGHSMVRSLYRQWNVLQTAVTVDGFWYNTFNSAYYPIHRLDREWVTDWRRLFSFDHPGGTAANPPIMAARIGTRLAKRLADIPIEAQPAPDPPGATLSANLAVRTLERAHRLLLNSAQEVARQVNDRLAQHRHPPLPFLRPCQLLANESPQLCEIMQHRAPGDSLLEHTPLWFYMLKEAEVEGCGNTLGPLGARIVMETLHASIEAASPSILDPSLAWSPDARLEPSCPDRYTFPDLLRFAGLV